MAAPLAPAIPAGVALGISFLALTASMLMWALARGYADTLGALLRSVAGLIPNVPFVGGKLKDAILAIDNKIVAGIETAAAELDKTASKFWYGAVWFVDMMVDSILGLARDTEAAIQGLAQGALPGKIADLRGELRRGIDGLAGRQSAQARAEALARTRGIDQLQRDVNAERHAREAAVAGVLGQVTARVDGIADTLRGEIADVVGYTRRNLARRLSKVEALVLGGALTVAAVRMLDRRFPYWKCTNVRRLNKAVCRMPTDALAGLLAVSAATALAGDPRAIAKAAQSAVDELAGIVRDLADV